MQVPVEITFRGMDRSAAVEERIREKAEWLETFHDHIMACRVVVEAPHKHHHKGRIYTVRVDLTVPGAELVANRAPTADHTHEDVYVALRDAFDAARRQLEGHARKRRGDVKAHAGSPEGTVSELDPEQGFGRIDTGDGRSIYFHRNSVLGDGFGALTVGSKVRYVEEAGDQGPQASTVHP